MGAGSPDIGRCGDSASIAASHNGTAGRSLSIGASACSLEGPRNVEIVTLRAAGGPVNSSARMTGSPTSKWPGELTTSIRCTVSADRRGRRPDPSKRRFRACGREAPSRSAYSRSMLRTSPRLTSDFERLALLARGNRQELMVQHRDAHARVLGVPLARLAEMSEQVTDRRDLQPRHARDVVVVQTVDLPHHRLALLSRQRREGRIPLIGAPPAAERHARATGVARVDRQHQQLRRGDHMRPVAAARSTRPSRRPR